MQTTREIIMSNRLSILWLALAGEIAGFIPGVILYFVMATHGHSGIGALLMFLTMAAFAVGLPCFLIRSEIDAARSEKKPQQARFS